MGSAIVWVCGLAGLSCASADAAAPSVSIIQSAYEREAASGSKLHDKGLTVVKADCDNLGQGQFLCQMNYLSTADPDQKLYFDVMVVALTDDGWRLKSGLCKR